MRRLAAPLVAVLLTAAATAQDGATVPKYTLTLIDPVPGMDTNSPRAINEAGEIAGVASPEPFHPVSVPVHVAADGTLTVLDVLDVAFNFAQGLNGQGLLVGASNTQAVIWLDGQPAPLAPTPGFFRGTAQDVNERGVIVGGVGDSDFAGPHPVLWRSASAPALSLPGLAGPTTSGSANAINDRGQVAGTVGSVGVFFAVRWDPPGGPPLQIGPLPRKDNSDGLGISARGDVVGRSSSITDFTTAAFLHVEKTGELIGLGHLPGATFLYSEAWGVNSRRQVVGSGNAGTESHGFLWQDGVLHDLNDLLVAPVPGVLYVQAAMDINEAGQIAAEVAVGPFPQTRIARLDPVPGP
jgi:probable HAF family extracellular repeat protein